MAFDSFLSGGIGVAIVSGIFMIIQHWMRIKADEKADTKKITIEAYQDSKESFKQLEKNVNGLTQAVRLLLEDRVIYLIRTYTKKGSVSFYDRKYVCAMANTLIIDLGSNGNIRALVERFENLPVVD